MNRPRGDDRLAQKCAAVVGGGPLVHYQREIRVRMLQQPARGTEQELEVDRLREIRIGYVTRFRQRAEHAGTRGEPRLVVREEVPVEVGLGGYAKDHRSGRLRPVGKVECRTDIGRWGSP